MKWSALPALVALAACDAPSTAVVFENGYAPATKRPIVVFDAFWQAVSFSTPLPPGAASDPQSTVAASPNTAYAVIAPGWDPASGPPPRLVALRSPGDFAVRLGDTLEVPIDDAHFAGDCDAGSRLSQDEADFVTQRVFANDFAGLVYDAATCTARGAP